MEPTEAVQVEQAVQPPQCAHFWPIPQLPENGVFHSRCTKCGAEKDFGTNIRVSQWPQKHKVSVAAFWKSYEAMFQKG